MERCDGMWWSGRNGVLELRAKSLGKRERGGGFSEEGKRRRRGRTYWVYGRNGVRPSRAIVRGSKIAWRRMKG